MPTAPQNESSPLSERAQSDALPVARRIAVIPDTITSIGLLAGCFSLISAISGHFGRAALMIGVSIACDVADGLVARASDSSSQFGLEYDSLSDVVAFGVAPATLAYAWALKPLGAWALLVVGAFVVCAALRLARFNIHAGAPGGKRRFVGLPVPGAAAMIAGALFGYRYFSLDSPRTLCAVMTFLMLLLAGLMVSRVPYPSIKGMDLRARATARTFVLIIVALGFLYAVPELMAFITATGYLLSGPFILLFGERLNSG
jgi:CDP-diacylglycerol--serine O-phosphatidyltransferase